jgi:long-chain-fatty-acyl-CoA reductase
MGVAVHYEAKSETGRKVLELPIVVCGELKHPSSDNRIVLSYDSGLEVHIPALDADDVEKMRQSTNEALASMHIDDIAIFMNELGKLWLDENFKFRKLATRSAAETTGYVGPSIYYDLGLLSTAVRRIKIYDMLESEIGDPYLLEEWIPRKTVYLHAEPRGKVVHIMVGNIPMAGLFSIVRSVLTKNLTIAKLPKRDILTSLLFALSFVELDPDHPITKSISVAYWEPGAPVEDDILQLADVVCAWGERDSIEPIKHKVGYGTEFVEFGPKRSLHMIGADTPDYDYAAMKAAYDISLYDQAACFSPQETFFEGDPGSYVAALGVWLENNLQRIPKRPPTDDEKAHISRVRQEARFRGWRVVAPDHSGWTIIVTDGPCLVEGHPLSRTAYIHPVNQLREALPFVDKDTQTVAIHPPERARELADDLVRRGVARITEVGRTGRPRPGFAHDGMFPMERLIRWVTIERGIKFKYKFWGLSPEEDDRLFYGRGEEPAEADPMLVWKVYEEVNLR